MTLLELTHELAARLGFASQNGADIIQAPTLQSILQRSQQSILDEFGSQLRGTTWPATPFVADSDTPSAPENPLMMLALAAAKEHYNQPAESAKEAWANFEAGARGFVK